MTTNRGRMFGKILAGAVLAAGVMAFASHAGATVLVDLRFADGSKDKTAAAGDYAIDVWVQVKGAVGNAALDGLQNIYGSVASAQLNGGSVLGDSLSGITSNAATAGGVWTITPTTGQPGTAQNLTADLIADWGTRSTVLTTTIKYSSTLGATPGTAPAFSNTPNVVSNAITDGTEFKVGTLNFHLATPNNLALPNGVTQISWVQPNAGGIPRAISAPDSVTDTANASYLNSNVLPVAADVNGVTFSVPEPASMALLGLGALALVARPRRKA